jgi:hypothetical protein
VPAYSQILELAKALNRALARIGDLNNQRWIRLNKIYSGIIFKTKILIKNIMVSQQTGCDPATGCGLSIK